MVRLLAGLALLTGLALGACRSTAQLDAAAYVDRYAQAYVAPSDCSGICGKGIFEKYGSQSPLTWEHYCSDNKNLAEHSWLKCAGEKNDYLCLGANVGLKASPIGPVAQTQTASIEKQRSTSLMHRQEKRQLVPTPTPPGSQGPLQIAISGCSWAAGENDISLKPMFPNQDLTLTPDSHEDSCTPLTSHKGNFFVMNLVDGWNPSLEMNQVLMAFATLAKLGLRPDQVRLVRVPSSDSGRCGDIAGCSPWGGNVLTNLDCRQCLNAQWRKQIGVFMERVLSRGGTALDLLGDQSLCLENAIFPIPPAQSFLWARRAFDDKRAERCSHSPILLGFADYVKDSFAGNVSRALLGPDAKLRITLPSRKPSPAHPVHYHREMTNEDELAQKLKEHFLSHANEKTEAAMQMMLEQLASELRSTGEFDVHEVLPPEMTIDEQVQAFSNTDLIIAPHGASLAWQVLQPECSQAIEFCVDGNFPFKNMAHYMGHTHTCLPGPAGWGANVFAADIKKTLARVREIKEEWIKCRKITKNDNKAWQWTSAENRRDGHPLMRKQAGKHAVGDTDEARGHSQEALKLATIEASSLRMVSLLTGG